MTPEPASSTEQPETNSSEAESDAASETWGTPADDSRSRAGSPTQTAESPNSLFAGVDTHDPEAIAEAIASHSSSAAEEIHELIAERDQFRQRSETLKQRLESKERELEELRSKKDAQVEAEQQAAYQEVFNPFVELRDDLERAISDAPDDSARGVDVEGLALVQKKFDSIIERFGLEPVQPKPGDDIDPDSHHVVSKVDCDTPSGTVATCRRPGYRMHGSLIRPARVTVSE